MEQYVYKPGADQQPAEVTTDKTMALVAEMFDLPVFAAQLRDENLRKVSLANVEKPLAYSAMPEGFAPSFYAAPDTPGGGIKETPTEIIFVQGLENQSVPAFDKREDTHLGVQNYKLRGARRATLHILHGSLKTNVFVTGSAGNHGMSQAETTKQLNELLPGDPLTTAIYCRRNIAVVKRNKLRERGAVVQADYNTLEDALSAAATAAEKPAVAMVHPFDDEPTIAGQATLVLEYVAQLKAMGYSIRDVPLRLRIPVGGGGLFAGSAAAWDWLKKEDIIHTDSELIAVEVEQNDSVAREIEGRAALDEATLDTDADGIATLRGGRKTVPVVAEMADRHQVVPKEYLVLACGKLASAHEGMAPELAGALSLAGLLLAVDTGETTASTPWRELTVTTGANVDRAVIQRLGNEYADHPDARVAAAALALQAVATRGRAMYNPRTEPGNATAQKRAETPTPSARHTLRVWDGMGR